MPLEESVRKELQKAVIRVRSVLTDDFTRQCKTIYGIQPDGTFFALDHLGHLSEDEKTRATVLRDRVVHLSATAEAKEGLSNAVDRMLREQAFTVLNRLCALRMCEERELVQECVRNGVESRGFRLFEETAAQLGGDTYSRYGLYLSLLCDELSLELGILFDRFGASAVLFPGEAALRQVLEELDRASLRQLWADDETIGWIYQYFNPEDERKRMRQESAVPQNSRELAVRNQFFTPRYVVEFLSDNTLGRIWYEMRKSETRLAETCRYMLRQPTEIFMAPDQIHPSGADEETGALQVPPAYIRHRPKKDPRDLRVIDPACGSGHFLLYAFDLLALIYEEAWADHDSPPFSQTGRALRDESGFSTLEDLRCAAPKLIIEHNLHGIDIDPRAVQIAALALRLRAQRGWKTLGVKATDRPRIDKSNLVTAAPMPGEVDMRREFTAGLRPRVVGQLVDVVFDKMALAGEAGSLLRIDADLKRAIADARAQWISGPKLEQTELFPELVKHKPEQQQFQFDVAEVTDIEFWEQAERRVLDELQEYGTQNDSGPATRRRFFSSDAIHGFEFVDLCHKRYDVVLMNPPFGSFSKRWASEAALVYPNSSNDILAAFVERFLSLLNPDGRLGAITSRTCFFLSSFRDWRLKVVLQESGVECIADLGQGVMDSAMVEAAAYVLQNAPSTSTTTVFRAIADADRRAALESALDAYNRGEAEPRLFRADPAVFRLLPDSPFTYWIDKEIVQRFVADTHFEPDVGLARNGMTTGDDFRWVRAMWEVPYKETIFCYYPVDGSSVCDLADPIVQAYLSRRFAGHPTWGFFVKAGASQPWYSPLTLKVNWASDGMELRNFRDANGKPRAFLRSRELYYRPGFSWTRRAVRFYPYTIPGGCIPSVSRYMAFPNAGMHAQAVAIFGSRIVSSFLRFYAEFWQRPNFLVDTVKMLPWPKISADDNSCFDALVGKEVDRRRRAYQNHEPFHEFLMPVKVRDFSGGGRALAFDPAALLDEDTERLVAKTFGFSDEQARKLDRDLLEAIAYQRGTGIDAEAANPEGNSETEEEEDSDFVLDYGDKAIEEAHLSYLLGCVYGRWDIRMARDPDLAPKLPHPFAPLPVCPPGTLVDPIGLPAESGQIVSEQWLRARPDAVTLPPADSVAQPTATDEEYPIPISWNGILVDDPGFDDAQAHPDDIVRRMGLALEALWKDGAHAVEQNACRILEFANLREYFRKPSGFFQDHLARYTKSKRKAPIYWPLSTESGKYTIWIYYPRLTDQTLFLCVNEYIDPKLLDIQGDLDRLKLAGSTDRKLRQQVDDLVDLQLELKALRAKLLEIAQLPYRPVQDDGVLISAAPLWPLFRYRPWHTELRKCWQLLSDGKYEWSHMAHNIWPQRVSEACRKDKSIAIAHGLENLYEEKEIKKARGRRR